jgi:glycosyltransferase involved in cell wall biosynthesis
VVFFAIDNDCVFVEQESRIERSVVLASRSGPRKGLEILPNVVRALPEWNFTLLGRNWENFIAESGLDRLENFSYQKLSKESRTRVFSQNQVFLSLSNLEGGPIPLIEAINLGLIPIATDTGFARDFIKNAENGFLLSTAPTVEEVKSAILMSSKIVPKENQAVNLLTWDRLARTLLTDHLKICHQKSVHQTLK